MLNSAEVAAWITTTGTAVVALIISIINKLKTRELRIEIDGLLIKYTHAEKNLSYAEGVRDEKARELDRSQGL